LTFRLPGSPEDIRSLGRPLESGRVFFAGPPTKWIENDAFSSERDRYGVEVV
jgi:hypothetical protein